MASQENDGYLDTKAVAAYLGVHKNTVYEAVKEGRIEKLGFRVTRLKRNLRFQKLEKLGVMGVEGVWVYEARIRL